MATNRPVSRACDRAVYEQDEGGKMTQRETLVDDLQNMEDVLLALEDVSNNKHLTEKGVIVLLARAVYHILVYAIRLMKKGE